jgi:hypothetical protein
VLLCLLRPASATAQLDPFDEERVMAARTVHGAYPLTLNEERAMAKARFAADQATLEQLTRERVKTARDRYRETNRGPYRFECFWDPPVREATGTLLQAEFAASGDLDRALELAWRIAWKLDKQEESRYLVGRSTAGNAAADRGNRLAVELDLLRLRERKPGPREPGDPHMSKWNPAAAFAWAVVAIPCYTGPARAYDDQLDESRELAKARFAADQAKPLDWLRLRVEAARLVYGEMRDRYEAGTITPEAYLAASVRLVEALQAATGQADSAAIAELAWRMAWLADEAAQFRYAAGRATKVDTGTTRDQRLRAEMELLRLRERKPEK